MALMTLRNISLSFGMAPILDGVNLTIEPGERVSLVGRNGTGKSSLMKIMAGVRGADEGTVIADEDTVTAYLPQDVPTDLEGSVYEVVFSGLGEAGEPVRLDSQCKYAVVARGQADAYLRLPTRKGYVERIWDHAAGCCIACESGAFVTDIFGRNLDFSHGRGLVENKGIVCAPPRVHGLMIRAIKELGIGKNNDE